jgi:hypothetical protein
MTSKEIAELSYEEREALKLRMSFKGMTVSQIVETWYKSDTPFELKPHEDRIRQRWDFAKAKFLALESYMDTAHALCEEFGISISQARSDIRNSKAAFGDLEEVSKAQHRQRAVHMALKAYKLAEKQDDPGGMVKATTAYIVAMGLDKEDNEAINLQKLMNEKLYVEALDPEIRNMMLAFIESGQGSTDISVLFSKIYEAKDSEHFVDYEDVPNASNDDDGDDDDE